MGTVIRKSGTSTGGGGTPTTSGNKIWRYKNNDYLTSGAPLNLKGEANPVNLIANTINNFKSVSDDIITTDFNNNEDAITPELDKIYRIQINFNLDVEVNDNTVELALREAISGNILQLGNVDSNKNVNTSYTYTFPLIKATSSIVTNGLHIDFLDVTSGGSFVNIYNIIVSIEEVGTAI
jgi:hypothetical protein